MQSQGSYAPPILPVNVPLSRALNPSADMAAVLHSPPLALPRGTSASSPALEDEQAVTRLGRQLRVARNAAEQPAVHVLGVRADVQLGQVVRVKAARQSVIPRAQLQEVALHVRCTLLVCVKFADEEEGEEDRVQCCTLLLMSLYVLNV